MIIVEFCRFGNIHDFLLKQRENFVNQITSDGKIDYNINTVTKYGLYLSLRPPLIVLVNNIDNEIKRKNSILIRNVRYQNIGDAVSGPSTEKSVCLNDGDQEPEWRSRYYGDYKDYDVNSICTHDLICWAFQIALGMDYLSRKKVRGLHGDVGMR